MRSAHTGPEGTDCCSSIWNPPAKPGSARPCPPGATSRTASSAIRWAPPPAPPRLSLGPLPTARLLPQPGFQACPRGQGGRPAWDARGRSGWPGRVTLGEPGAAGTAAAPASPAAGCPGAVTSLSAGPGWRQTPASGLASLCCRCLRGNPGTLRGSLCFDSGSSVAQRKPCKDREAGSSP